MPSTSRRRLLMLLWGEGARGSVAQLAERADISFTSAHRELKAMRRHQLASYSRDEGRSVYWANEQHPHADVLRGLATMKPAPPRVDGDAAEVRARLKLLGAPLEVDAADTLPDGVETALIDGVLLSRRDPTAARVLPLCFWKARRQLDWRALLGKVKRAEDKHAVGFFVDVTGALAKNAEFTVWAEMFRDGRIRAQREFFESPATRGTARMDDGPGVSELAQKWGFRMSMNMASFESTFKKFVELDD